MHEPSHRTLEAKKGSIICVGLYSVRLQFLQNPEQEPVRSVSNYELKFTWTLIAMIRNCGRIIKNELAAPKSFFDSSAKLAEEFPTRKQLCWPHLPK